MDPPGRRQVTRLAVILALAGCVETGEVSGRPPERVTRDLPRTDSTAAQPSFAARYKEHENKADAGEPTVEKTDPAETRIGVDSTHVFHRAECLLLKGVPVAQQVRFTSRWDALDGGYRPCEECKSAK